jgi:hypothetical protein
VRSFLKGVEDLVTCPAGRPERWKLPVASYYAVAMSATSLPARIGYAIVVAPLGAVLGYVLALKLLIKFGSIFQDPHSSMQGFGYFMMSLASAATFAVMGSLVAITLPWKRPIKASGKVGRIVVSVVLLGIAFLILAGQGHALIFVLAVIGCLALMFYLTYIRHGVLDAKQDNPAAL